MVRPGQQGQFTVANLPPGEYLVAAVDWVEEGTEDDPALLEELRGSGVRAQLGEGEQRTVALRLAEPRK